MNEINFVFTSNNEIIVHNATVFLNWKRLLNDSKLVTNTTTKNKPRNGLQMPKATIPGKHYRKFKYVQRKK